MTSLFAWSSRAPRWLAVLLLLGMLAAVVLLVAGLDPTAQGEIGSWRWTRLPHLG
jgi:hypothetical protein